MMIRPLKKDKPSSSKNSSTKVIAKVVIMGKNLLQFKDINAAIHNKIQDFLGKKVEFLLVSATVGDPNNGNRGVVGPPAYLERVQYPVVPELFAGENTYLVNFMVDESQGIPGAVIVRNRHRHQFYLNSITIENFPGQGRIHFDCKSWVYNISKYSYDRIFFANNSYLPKNTPEPLHPYRQDELRNLRGDGVNRKLEEWDRVYSYDYYNDLGDPDENPNLARPVLGGSVELPYPRRCKTGRGPSKTDPKSETKVGTLELVYVPCDESFGHNKMLENFHFIGKKLLPYVKYKNKKFESFKDLLKLYEGGYFPIPQVIQS